MIDEKEYELNQEEVLEQKRKLRNRERNVDFQRIESPEGDAPLSKFELEAHKRLASVPSGVEREVIRKKKRDQSVKRNAFISALLKKAKLTQREKEVFALFYRKGLNSYHASRELKMSQSQVCQLRRAGIKKLKEACEDMNISPELMRSIS